MIAPEILQALLLTVLTLCFPYWSWSHMLEAVLDQEEAKRQRTAREARWHEETIHSLLEPVASAPARELPPLPSLHTGLA